MTNPSQLKSDKSDKSDKIEVHLNEKKKPLNIPKLLREKWFSYKIDIL